MSLTNRPIKNKARKNSSGFFNMPDEDERSQLVSLAEQGIRGSREDGSEISPQQRIGALNRVGRLPEPARADILSKAQISTQRMSNTLNDLTDRIEGKPQQERNDPYATLFDTTPEILQTSLDRSRAATVKGKSNLAVNLHSPAQSDADPIAAIGTNTQVAQAYDLPGYQWGGGSGPVGHINKAERDMEAAGKQIGTDGNNIAGGAKARGLEEYYNFNSGLQNFGQGSETVFQEGLKFDPNHPANQNLTKRDEIMHQIGYQTTDAGIDALKAGAVTLLAGNPITAAFATAGMAYEIVNQSGVIRNEIVRGQQDGTMRIIPENQLRAVSLAGGVISSFKIPGGKKVTKPFIKRMTEIAAKKVGAPISNDPATTFSKEMLIEILKIGVGLQLCDGDVENCTATEIANAWEQALKNTGKGHATLPSLLLEYISEGQPKRE